MRKNTLISVITLRSVKNPPDKNSKHIANQLYIFAQPIFITILINPKYNYYFSAHDIIQLNH